MFLNSIVRRNLLSATVLYLQNAYWHREIVVLRISSVNYRNAIRHFTPPLPLPLPYILSYVHTVSWNATIICNRAARLLNIAWIAQQYNIYILRYWNTIFALWWSWCGTRLHCRRARDHTWCVVPCSYAALRWRQNKNAFLSMYIYCAGLTF